MEPLLSDKGGMIVTLDGIAQDDAPMSHPWQLIANQNHGHIPCAGAIALTRIAASKVAKKLPQMEG